MSTPAHGGELRRMFGHWATGVAVITSRGANGRPVGFTCNSFTSVSLDPPLVLFCVARASSSWPLMRPSNRFRVNVLGHGQRALGRRFTSKDTDRFAGVDWRDGAAGPVLEGAVATLAADVVSETDGGDHVVVVGRVTDYETRAQGEPLVFYRGEFGTFTPSHRLSSADVA
ncbi:flavin reductase family protein [Nocardiopsis chromatogenes]|uniref:flavin reductase family protein n=1 Tax=Nocardiopsis chromatogenes TaxID=280239 RepID=UPI000593EACD|nr:flavin reductase family protein [Nocardiopsis chromatogenes]